MTAKPPPATLAQRPILVADDDEGNVRHLERQLRRAGLENPLIDFRNADDLLAFLGSSVDTTDPKPCVLFLDPKMPGANGYDPVRWVLRERSLADLRVVIVSDVSDPSDAETAAELGIRVFLKKQPDLTSLAPIIDYLRSGMSGPGEAESGSAERRASAA
jgi:CheY-like chemotaxis protein